MINTKLVLLEGPPGSGKTTTAQMLADAIAQSGTACSFYFEWSPDHPIPIGNDLQLREVINTAITREAEMLQLWRRFTQARQTGNEVTVLESRFWQTSVMLEYVAGRTIEGVLESNRRVVDILRPLNPVLIYFDISNPRAFAARTIALKEEEWQRAGLPGSWVQHLYDAMDGQPWFTARGLSGHSGLLALLEEWAEVSDQLYAQLPFPKLRLRDPHLDWADAMNEMQVFLGLG